MDKIKGNVYEFNEKSNKLIPCRFYKNGFCKFSNKCKFSHSIELVDTNTVTKENPTKSESSLSNNCPISTSIDYQSEAELAKTKGNKFYMEGDYNKAYEMYSLAIIYSTEALATFYSNRSNTCIQMKDFYKALTDAEKCIELRPNWSKGYYRKKNMLIEKKTEKKSSFKLSPVFL